MHSMVNEGRQTERERGIEREERERRTLLFHLSLRWASKETVKCQRPGLDGLEPE